MSAGVPGPRDPSLTPYVIAPERSAVSGQYQRIIVIQSAQSGKTDFALDLIGERLDQRPCPILYVGPTLRFLHEQFEPRLMELFDQAKTLSVKLVRGRRMSRTRKIVAGVSIRLGHAGSPTSLKSDPVGMVIVDEYVDMQKSVKAAGDPLTLAELRGESYPDFVTIVISTPSEGVIGIKTDEATGLEFWDAKPEEVICPQFKLFLEGTRRHFCWPCRHCHRYFVPRFKNLRWPKGATPFESLHQAWLECPRCGGKHHEADKAAMNAGALFVAPGQTISKAGVVEGDAPDSTSDSYWTSGLCAPFKSFGQRAEAFLRAKKSGDMEKVRAIVNGAFAELWAPGGGELPQVSEVRACCLPYKMGEAPDGIRRVTCGVDVQKDRLVVVTRGWGGRAESWLLHHFELWARNADGELSDTGRPEIWNDLAEYLEDPGLGRHRINLCVIDSGYRPGKRNAGAEHPVYDFCRRHQRHTRPAKGVDVLASPLVVRRIEVTPAGKLAPYSLQLLRVNTDYFKLFIHERIRWPKDQPGAWHLPENVSDEYISQLLSESRVHTASGRPKWIELGAQNHAFDCEALNAVGAYLMNTQRMVARGSPRPKTEPQDVAADRAIAQTPPQALKTESREPPVAARPPPLKLPRRVKRRSRSGWLGR